VQSISIKVFKLSVMVYGMKVDNLVPKIHKSGAAFSKSAEKDMIIGAVSGIVSSLVVVPKLNTYIQKYTGNERYTGLVDLGIGIGLIFLAMHLSDGWAALVIGMGAAFILEGVTRVIFPTLAAQGTASGAPAIVSVLAHYGVA